MSEDQATTWLEKEDSVCREGRLARLDWLARLARDREYLSFPGGQLAKYLFEEARYCFTYGQFVAAIVLGMAYVEHTLAALFYAAGHSELANASISELLREATNLNWIDQAHYDALDHARSLRNAITHFRAPLHKETLEHRSVVNNEMPYAVLEEDAREVMQVVFRLFDRSTLFWYCLFAFSSPCDILRIHRPPKKEKADAEETLW